MMRLVQKRRVSYVCDGEWYAEEPATERARCYQRSDVASDDAMRTLGLITAALLECGPFRDLSPT